MSGPRTPEGLLIFLLSGPGSIPVVADVPKDRPPVMITVERVGGSTDRFLNRGVYAFQAWAPTRAQAADLSERLAQAILELPSQSGRIAAASVVSIVNLPDPDSHHPRYQVTANVTTTV